MYIIRQYDDLTKEDKFKQSGKQIKSVFDARHKMKSIAEGNENGGWILWKKSGQDWIKLQVIQNLF